MGTTRGGMKLTADDTRLAADWRWQLAQRIVASTGFEKSLRLKAFLMYVTEKALQEHPEEVTEKQIGMHVFGRPAGYNSGSDNVVRTQARLLRTRLEQYFATEGTGETTTNRYPKRRLFAVVRGASCYPTRRSGPYSAPLARADRSVGRHCRPHRHLHLAGCGPTP